MLVNNGVLLTEKKMRETFLRCPFGPGASLLRACCYSIPLQSAETSQAKPAHYLPQATFHTYSKPKQPGLEKSMCCALPFLHNCSIYGPHFLSRALFVFFLLCTIVVASPALTRGPKALTKQLYIWPLTLINSLG